RACIGGRDGDMGDTEDEVEIPYRPGLEKVPVCISNVCYLDGDVGALQYRGYPIEELARHSTYEEVACLLVFGKLPTRAGLEQFSRDPVRHRRLKFGILDMMK